MKRILITSILGLAPVTSVLAQTAIQLYNFDTPSAGSIVYAAGPNSGQPISAGGYTVGFYWAFGDVTASVNAATGGATTTAGANIGTMTGTGLTLGTGANCTAPLGVDGPGLYDNVGACVISPSSISDQLITVVLVAYNGASYETSSLRGHSAAFTMTAKAAPAFALLTGNFAGGFAVGIPEPSIFALAGLGLAGLLIFRRRN